MQLTPPGRTLGARLAAAACLLVGASSGPAEAVEVSTANLFYSESGRVTVLETHSAARHEWAEGKAVSVQLVLDSLTGASANGAPAANVTQVFTRPSGNGSYLVPAGETPLDDTFHDTRYHVAADLEWPLGRMTSAVLGTHYSTEFDYDSIGASARLSHDLFQRNTTLSMGVSGSRDTVSPVGGAPDPLALMQLPGNVQPKGGGSRDKTVVDIVAGVTQVMDRATLVQVNYSMSRFSGYLTDPYKLVGTVQGEGDASPGTPVSYRYEARPDRRTKQAVYGQAKHSFGRDVLDVSYRYLWDDWGIGSHTAEATYFLRLNDVSGLEPHLRFYHQGAADFFVYGLVAADPLPEFASGDYRLGTFDAWTATLKYQRQLRWGVDVAVRGGYYVQMGDSHPADAIGTQRDQDLFPTVGAVLSQLNLSYAW